MSKILKCHYFLENDILFINSLILLNENSIEFKLELE